MKLLIPDNPRRVGRRVGLVLALALVSWTAPGHATPGTTPFDASNPQEAPDRATVAHVLSRLTWGPRPGDIEAVQAVGLRPWIEGQLHPEKIDDADAKMKLQALETFGLSSGELLEGYNPPREIRREVQKVLADLGEDASEADRRRARRDLIARYGGQMKGPPRQVLVELQAAKVVRVTESHRQLNEVLVDFWLNHFNVYAGKGPVLFLTAEHERTIREHAWGRFEDLLRAMAESPAMLFYLDNWLSVDPAAAQERQRRRGMRMRRPGRRPEPAAARRSGLNENYARELLELHTLGVDGGYTQADVTEVARAFTGWTIRGLRQNRPEFAFDWRVHDAGDKQALGETIHGGGEDEGRRIIRMLARHPATARFVSYKLARRFVSDEPPPALVERAAATWGRTGGQIREVVRTIVTSPEFLGPDTRGAKVKTPLEFVASAVRASGAEVDDGRHLARRVGEMGMPLYLRQPPTGYEDTADAWVSTSGLVARLNFALELAGGLVPGVKLDRTAILAAAREGVPVTDVLADWLVPSGLSEVTKETIEVEVAAGLTPTRVAGLILGSPEFQRR
jgi:uncharacterized protein (DUF1800 family)